MVDLMVSEQQSGAVEKGVPAGFKLTEVGIIPEDWECKYLGELGDIVRGGSPRPAGDPKYFEGDFIPWLTVASLTTIPDAQQIVMATSSMLTELGSKHSRTLEKGTLIISNSGATLGVAKLLGIKCCANDGVAAIINQRIGNKSFLIHYINTITKSLHDKIATGNGQPNLNTDLIRLISVPFPNEQEQEKIADTLSDCDNFILKLEQLIAKKQAIKTATMQQLLTGKTRLPQFVLWEDGVAKGYKKSELGDIPEDWVVTNIGQFTDCCAGGTPSTKILAYWGGIHPWMSSGELHLKQVYAVADYITDEGLVNSSTKYVPKNSVLVGLAGQGKTRGTVAINRIELCTNQSIAAIFPSENHSTDFLFYNLGNRYEELRSLSTGDGGRGGLNLTIIRKVHIVLPPKEEQIAIAAILSDMDKEIQILQQRLDKTRQLKQGMMQELLTGKIRLIERN
ncbi:TPA: restriction endonuclease subunit S [Serratia fonticola]|nr:restriction endonuclease subunit S [uncultured Rahnella sp.]